jgi:hypothetical protein
MDTKHVETETYITIEDVFVIKQTIDGETNSIFIVDELAEHIFYSISEYLILTNYKRQN